MSARRIDTALVGEVASPEALVAAVRGLRDLGYRRLDARAPFEIEGLAEAIGLRARPVTKWTLFGGLAGGLFALLFQDWISAVDWPLDVGGRPLHSIPAFIPITFESTVLFAGLATFAGLVVHARLGRLWEPLDEVDLLGAATVDGFFVLIDGDDPRLDWEAARAHLASVGATRIVALHEQSVEVIR